MRRGAGFREVYEMGKHDLTIFRYSTMLTLTRNGIDTLERLDGMTNEQIAHLRGMGRRSYEEILTVLERNNGKTRQSDNTGRR